MTDTTITALPPASSLSGTEPVPVDQSGITVRTTAQDIANLANVMAVNQSAATAYTFALVDALTYIEFTSGSAVAATLPTNASVAFPIGTTITFEQNGAGVVTVVASGGVTLQSAGSLVSTNGQYAVASVVKKATNSWVLFGNLA